MIGNVDSGKSTFEGSLTKNIKDDGRGYARKFVFYYQHESETGRISSIAYRKKFQKKVILLLLY